MITAFWDITLCSLIEVDQHFSGANHLHHQGVRIGNLNKAIGCVTGNPGISSAKTLFSTIMLQNT
jgi:hypothetical protein